MEDGVPRSIVTGMNAGITRAVVKSNGLSMQVGMTRAVMRKRRSWGGVVREIVIMGFDPYFYLSPPDMRLQGVRVWLAGSDPVPDPDPVAGYLA